MIRPSDLASSVVRANPACARVLQRHNIDFCGSAPETIASAAASRGLALGALLDELSRAEPARHRFDTLSDEELVERITSRFHLRLREVLLPWVTTHAGRAARLQGSRFPRLRRLDKQLLALAREIAEHTVAEETFLFPAIAAGERNTIERALLTMHDEHVVVRQLLADVRASRDELEGTDCEALLAAVDALELEILLHMHAENHVLLPRCAAAD